MEETLRCPYQHNSTGRGQASSTAIVIVDIER